MKRIGFLVATLVVAGYGQAGADDPATVKVVSDAPRCDDQKLNGSESDTDCGGSCPRKCGKGLKCNQQSDCAAGLDCSSTMAGSCGGDNQPPCVKRCATPTDPAHEKAEDEGVAPPLPTRTGPPPAPPASGDIVDKDGLYKWSVEVGDLKPVWESDENQSLPPDGCACQKGTHPVLRSSPDSSKKKGAWTRAKQKDWDQKRANILACAPWDGKWAYAAGDAQLSSSNMAWCAPDDRFVDRRGMDPISLKRQLDEATGRMQAAEKRAADSAAKAEAERKRAEAEQKKAEAQAQRAEDERKKAEAAKSKPAVTDFKWIALRLGLRLVSTRAGVSGSLLVSVSFPLTPRLELTLGGGLGVSPTRGMQGSAMLALDGELWRSKGGLVSLHLGLGFVAEVDAGNRLLYRSEDFGPVGRLGLRVWRFWLTMNAGWAIHVDKPAPNEVDPRLRYDGWVVIPTLTFQPVEK